MRAIPATLQTTYANLVQAHLNRPAFEFQGAPFTMVRKGKTYWYANQRSEDGTTSRQRYIGPDTDEMRVRIDAMKTQQQSQADFRAHSSSLVAQLRAGGIAGPDRKTGPILRALVNSGAFRLGGTLVGTHAFRHYDLVLGAYLSDSTAWIAQTDDIDVASFHTLSMAIEDTTDPQVAKALGTLDFRPVPTIGKTPPTTWTLADGSYAIDFLTPSFSEEDKPAHIPTLDIWAKRLHFLNYLIADPIPAVSPYMEGLLIQIPQPARYAIHKLIIAQRRKDFAEAKRRKDIEQARSLIWAMSEDQPYVLAAAIKDADRRGKKWKAALDQALTLQIIPDDPIQPGDSAEFHGKALGGASVRLRISGSALVLLAGEDKDTLFLAKKHRDKIEKMFRTRFRSNPAENILLTSQDLPAA